MERLLQLISDCFNYIWSYLLQFIQYEKISLAASFAKALITLKRSSEIHFKVLVLEFIISNTLAITCGVLASKSGFASFSLIVTAVVAFAGSKLSDYFDKYIDIYLNNLKDKENDNSN